MPLYSYLYSLCVRLDSLKIIILGYQVRFIKIPGIKFLTLHIGSYVVFKYGTFCECLQMVCTKTFTKELMDVSRLWDLNELKLLIFRFLSVVLKVKHGLDKIGREKNGLAQDAVPESAPNGRDVDTSCVGLDMTVDSPMTSIGPVDWIGLWD